MMARGSLATAVLSVVVLAAAPTASLGGDDALVARTKAVLSVYRYIRDTAGARRGIAAAPRIGAVAPRFVTARAPGTIDAVPHRRGDVRTAIRRASSEHLIPVRLILAVIAAESAFDPRAVSRAGARGLMQVMPATARDLGVDPNDLFDPCINVHAGTRYMRVLADSFDGRTRDVLAAYNAGPERVLSRGSLPGETMTYLRRVEAHYNDEVGALPRAWRERLAIGCGVP